jgi:tripartite-type tricarboxylate transporter receptor subunit TctC
MIARVTAVIFSIAAAAMAQLVPAAAQDWPSRPVHILVGFGAGGGTDVATRILADGLSEALGQQFTVENRPGAGGTIAGGVAARAPKDGYNLLAISMGHAVSAVMVKQVPYDPINDFVPVGIFTNSAFVVAVAKDSPVTDIKGLVEYINEQSGKLNYSTVTRLDAASYRRTSAPADRYERSAGFLPHVGRSGQRIAPRRCGFRS